MSAPETTAAPAGAAGAALRVADPWRRLMSLTYEGIILFGVLWFFDYGFSAITQFRGEPGPLRHAFQAFTWAVLGAYFVYFWSAGRRTLPMKTMSLLLVDASGTPLTAARAAARYAIATALPIGALALAHYANGWLALLIFLPYAWTLVDRQRCALYDRLAGTRLVVAPVAAPPRRAAA